jgi:hypothetical protein
VEIEGSIDRYEIGLTDRSIVGCIEGWKVGSTVGREVGCHVVGCNVGLMDGQPSSCVVDSDGS